MKALPESVIEAWSNKEGPAVFATVDANGMPNVIYVGSLRVFPQGYVVVADNYFNKTRANILAGSKGSLLFITKEKKSFQLKGRLEYLREGALYDAMKQWNPSKHPGVAAAVLRVEQAFSGAEVLA